VVVILEEPAGFKIDPDVTTSGEIGWTWLDAHEPSLVWLLNERIIFFVLPVMTAVELTGKYCLSSWVGMRCVWVFVTRRSQL
jgi:hypothetical protein